jgi:hypothetical protein
VDSQSSGRDLNSGPPEYEATLHLTRDGQFIGADEKTMLANQKYSVKIQNRLGVFRIA